MCRDYSRDRIYFLIEGAILVEVWNDLAVLGQLFKVIGRIHTKVSFAIFFILLTVITLASIYILVLVFQFGMLQIISLK